MSPALAAAKGTAAMTRRRLPSWVKRLGWSRFHLVVAVLMVAAGGFATSEAWADIARIALRDEESSHVFLVPIVAAWLVWVRRCRFRLCRPRGQLVGPGLVAVGWAMHSLGDVWLVDAAWHAGALLVCIGCLVAVVGTDVLRHFLAAFVVLGFLVPVPGMVRQGIAIPLQAATAAVTQMSLETVGVPCVREGNNLSVNGVDVTIAEACNGLRMVFALVLVSYAFAFGSALRPWARMLVLVASPVSAILCNVTRLVPTVWVYGSFPPDLATQVHDVSGWLMVPIAFLFLIGMLRVLRWAHVPVTRYVLAYGS